MIRTPIRSLAKLANAWASPEMDRPVYWRTLIGRDSWALLLITKGKPGQPPARPDLAPTPRHRTEHPVSTSISAYATRDEIKNLVTLLCLTPDQDNPYIAIDSTTVNGDHEEPVTVQRAYRECADKAAEDDFEPGRSPELFDTDHDFDTDEVTVKPIEEHDPEADRRVACEIVAMLTARFSL